MRRLILLAIALTVSAGLVTIAGAAEPSSGKVSAASPKVAWGGTLSSSGITYNAWDEDPAFECSAPTCDRFTLEVEGGGVDLIVKLNMLSTNADGSDPGCGIRIVTPAGENQVTKGSCSEKTAMKVTVKKAPAGTYLIDSVSSHVCCGAEDYTATAELAVAAPPPATTPPVTTTTTPPATPQSQTKLTVKVPKLSAKKLAKAKKFTATLTTSATLNDVNALLVNKKKKLGSGKLATFNGTAKVTIKLKGKIKKGTYTLTVGGKDASGANVVATAKAKVSK